MGYMSQGAGAAIRSRLSGIALGHAAELLHAQQLGNRDRSESALAQTAQDERQRRCSKSSMLAITFVTVVHQDDIAGRDAR